MTDSETGLDGSVGDLMGNVFLSHTVTTLGQSTQRSVLQTFLQLELDNSPLVFSFPTL